MSATIEDFLTKQDEQEIVQAIIQAEKLTSGEIRVHIEDSAIKKGSERAYEVFHLLKMDETELKNGVLIYVAVGDKTFVICGDKRINDVVPHDFWEDTKSIIQKHFKVGNFKQGIIDGILLSGEQLKKYFPWADTDKNELDNEISKG